MKIKITGTFEFNENMFGVENNEEKGWFFDEILLKKSRVCSDPLIVSCPDVGDYIGDLQIETIEEVKKQTDNEFFYDSFEAKNREGACFGNYVPDEFFAMIKESAREQVQVETERNKALLSNTEVRYGAYSIDELKLIAERKRSQYVEELKEKVRRRFYENKY